ncbi:MAG: response regulator [Burkholderiales bacterium]|jgi:DNA-binding NtrC family response regulator|nr:response regulator [Burkholderiales bacterium]MCE2984365.1 response regulator [Burkholderiales bacterium]
MANILVVDDEIGIRELLSEILGDEGHLVHSAESAAKAKNIRAQESIDLVLLDIWMPECDGISLLKEWVAQGLQGTPVIMMSGHATIDTAVEATRFGALDFLEKPITLQKLLTAVQKGLTRSQLNKLAAALAPSPAHENAPTSTGSAASKSTESPVAHPALPNVPAAVFPIDLDLPLREARDEFERLYFEHHLARENYSMTRVAEKTGLERTHLYRKLKHLGVELARNGKRAVSSSSGHNGSEPDLTLGSEDTPEAMINLAPEPDYPRSSIL